jgi:uncharacterized protein
MELVFEWDEGKNSANQDKHGVSFEEARSAFLDENARVMPDPEHSEAEERFILLEKSNVSTAGGFDEETLRLCQIRKESLSPQAEEATHHSARRGHD